MEYELDQTQPIQVIDEAYERLLDEQTIIRELDDTELEQVIVEAHTRSIGLIGTKSITEVTPEFCDYVHVWRLGISEHFRRVNERWNASNA